MDNNEDDLWALFTQQVKPLPPQKQVVIPTPKKVSLKKGSLQPRGGPRLPPASPHHVVKVHEGLDRSLAALVKKGRREVEATLDLHGATQEQAWERLRSFIVEAYGRQKRLVVVVTGKGTAPGGVLRLRLPQWIQEDFFSPLVISLSEALPQHGGSGAFYVLLRRSSRRGDDSL